MRCNLTPQSPPALVLSEAGVIFAAELLPDISSFFCSKQTQILRRLFGTELLAWRLGDLLNWIERFWGDCAWVTETTRRKARIVTCFAMRGRWTGGM